MAELTAHQKEWVAALRSGRYLQGRKRLKRVTSHIVEEFCCLGVAVELCPAVEWENTFDDGPKVRSDDGLFVHHGLPTKPVLDWLDTQFRPFSREGGADSHVGSVRLDLPKPDGDVWYAMSPDLYVHNDAGMTFDQIADLIEYFGLVPIQTLNKEA